MGLLLQALVVAVIGYQTALAQSYEPEKLAVNLQKIKQGLRLWEAKGEKGQAWQVPLLRDDLSQYQAASYLNFYQGAAYFLQSFTPSFSPQERHEHLKRALTHLTCAASHPPAAVQAGPWLRQASEKLAELSYQRGRYFEAIKILGGLSALTTSSTRAILLYGESLRATRQETRLKRLLLAHDEPFSQNLDSPLLKPHRTYWQKLLNDIAALKQKERARQTSLAATASPAQLPLATISTEASWRERWGAFLQRLEAAYFADHGQAFTPFLDQYLTLLEKQTGERSSEDVVFLGEFQSHWDKLSPSLLRQTIKKLWDWQQLEAALAASAVFLSQFKGHPDYPQVAYDRARLWEDSGKPEQAWQELQKHAGMLWGSSQEENFLFRSAWLGYLAAKPEASALFSRYLQHYPAGQFEQLSHYYRFKLAKSKGEELEAASKEESLRQQVEAFIASHPLSYYSVKLLNEYQLPAQLVFDKLPLQRQGQSLRPEHRYFPMALAEQQLFALYEELQRLGLEAEAFSLLQRLDRSLASQPAWLAYTLQQHRKGGKTDLLTLGASKVLQAYPELYPYVGWQDLYPRFLEKNIVPLLQKAASPLPYEFVLALIRQESAFNPRAVSTANAQGLMQLMPHTAKGLASELKKERFDLFRPEDNLELGIKLLNRLHAKYRGQHAYILSAYNAGEKVTDRWVAFRGHLAQDEFIESIPYQETRNYVKLVLRNWAYYRLIYPGKAQLSSF